MAENDPTIELPAEGDTDTNENRDKPDLRRSLRKQQVMTPSGVDRTNSRPETRTSSKKNMTPTRIQKNLFQVNLDMTSIGVRCSQIRAGTFQKN